VWHALLILAANRLPVTVRRVGSGFEVEPSPGGLATALGAVYKEHGASWVGWPGDIPPAQQALVERQLIRRLGCHPVFLPQRLARPYYAGFSNRTLWPLFHSFPSYARYDAREWDAYVSVNRLFRDAILRIAAPDDLIWVHDYHLTLLPRFLRETIPRARLGVFIHIPFPSYDTLRLLPWHKEILEGLLAADLIGFHTYGYANAFLGSVRRALGHEHELGRIEAGGHAAQVDAFPMGVDFARFSRAQAEPAVRARIARFRGKMGEVKILLSLSRLDYTKGLGEQLRSFQTFLEAHPEWRGRIVYVFLVVPSRERVDRYAQLKREIDELVGRINSRYGTVEWTPIRYIYRTLGDVELQSIYAAADVALVTPLRDGMNLVCKEYLATKADGRGVLILSEMAGAATELREALVVNPNDEVQVAEAIHTALAMPEDEQVRRNRTLRDRLERSDVRAWALAYVARFADVTDRAKPGSARALRPQDVERLASAYVRGTRRLLLLDYDGTLVPFTTLPGEAAPPVRVLRLLERLAKVRGNDVFLVSGRRREEIDAWFASLPIHCVAEHGAWHRPRDAKEWQRSAPTDVAWKDRLRPVFEVHAARLPGSFVEEKDASIAWHYRNAEPDVAPDAAKEFFDTLSSVTANTDLSVLSGNRVLEVKSSRVGKGAYFATRLAADSWDFILAIGDDATDEELFAVLPPDAFSIRVGSRDSRARFVAESHEDVLSLLEGLASS